MADKSHRRPHDHKGNFSFEGHKNNTSALSNNLIDEGIQVNHSTVPIGQVPNHHHHHHHPRASTDAAAPIVVATTKQGGNWLPKFLEVPPEEIRGIFLNHAAIHWDSSVQIGRILAVRIFSTLQLIIYFLVFGMSGHYRVIVALLPTRETLVTWFFLMFGADFSVYIILRMGRHFTRKYDLSQAIDIYFMLLASTILFVNFIASFFYPAFTAPYLLVSVEGTPIHNDTPTCLEARDDFGDAGSSWNSIARLRTICKTYILCIEDCRDFRSLYFGLYATYIMTIVRFFVFITLWSTLRFLCIMVNSRRSSDDDED